MWKYLRMASAIVAALAVAACVPMAIIFGMLPFWVCVCGALLCFALSLLFKFLQEEKEGVSGAPDEKPSAATDAATPDKDKAKADADAAPDDAGTGERDKR